MGDPLDDRAVTAGQRAVDQPADRVLEDRYTDDDGAGGGGGGGGQPAIPSPFRPKVDPNFVEAPRDHPLRKALAQMAARTAFKNMRFALVDMTADKTRPVYAGSSDTARVFVASMAKLALLLPSFSLRESAREAAAILKPMDGPKFLAQLNKAWQPEIRRYFRNGKAKDSHPRLDQILGLTRNSSNDPYEVDFARPPASNPTQAAYALDLELAVQRSSNDSAGVCIQALGFPYIKGVHDVAGLGAPRGFALDVDYRNNFWDPAIGGTHEEASARAVASLLTLISQDRFVVPGLIQDLRDVMWWNGSGVSGAGLSDIAETLHSVLPQQDAVTLVAQGKIGYVEPGRHGDSAIISRAAGKSRIRYVAVALGADDHETVQQAGLALDDCILIANGLPPKQPPGP